MAWGDSHVKMTGCSSSRLQDENSIFLAVKVSFRVTSKGIKNAVILFWGSQLERKSEK